MKADEAKAAEPKKLDSVTDQDVNKKDPGLNAIENIRSEVLPDPLILPPRVKDYRFFTSILNEHAVPYMVDSGVLLGLMREGRLLGHEKDIDLQMWAEDEDKLLGLLPLLWEEGFQITIWLYRGLACQYRFLKEDQLPVHVMLFRQAGDLAWCPAGEGTGPPFPREVTKYLYHYFVVARRKLRERLIVTEVTRWPWKARRRVGTWLVPLRFFSSRVYHPLFNCYIPREWEHYLIYRYGSWRIPATKWNIWRNDGALKQVRPEKMLDFSGDPAWKGSSLLKAARKKVQEK